MSDDLDTKTDAQLDELFAVEVAGWHRQEERWPSQPYTRWTWRDKPGGDIRACDLRFTTDANAVLPWLEKHGWKGTSDGQRAAVVVLAGPDQQVHEVRGIAPTFARAAVIALIRAKRATK